MYFCCFCAYLESIHSCLFDSLTRLCPFIAFRLRWVIVALFFIQCTRDDPSLMREMPDPPEGLKTSLEVSQCCTQLNRTM